MSTDDKLVKSLLSIDNSKKFTLDKFSLLNLLKVHKDQQIIFLHLVRLSQLAALGRYNELQEGVEDTQAAIEEFNRNFSTTLSELISQAGADL